MCLNLPQVLALVRPVMVATLGTNVVHLTNIGIPGTDAVAAGTCTPSARAESPERHVDVGIAITDQGPPRNGNNGVGTGVTPPIESTKNCSP